MRSQLRELQPPDDVKETIKAFMLDAIRFAECLEVPCGKDMVQVDKPPLEDKG